MQLTIDPALAGKVRLGLLTLTGVTVRGEDDVLGEEIERCARELRERYGGGKSAEVPGAAEARALYKELGLDPTKTRPSNEALLRRALKGEPLYRINTLVDAMNLCSLRAQLPFGLYDLEQLEPPVSLRLGAAGEGYDGIRKSRVNVEGRPVLVDSRGPFGNPTSDSARTMVRIETHEALVVVYAPVRYAPTRLESVLHDTAATLVRWCGGAVAESRLLP